MKRSHLWAIFFLVLFLGAKSLEFHPLGHADEDSSDRCELCDYALLLQDTPFTAPQVTFLEGHIAIIAGPVSESNETLLIISRELPAGQFYRPPPPSAFI